MKEDQPPPTPRKLYRGVIPKLVPILPFNTYPREEAIKYLRSLFNTYLRNYEYNVISFVKRDYYIKEYEKYKKYIE